MPLTLDFIFTGSDPVVMIQAVECKYTPHKKSTSVRNHRFRVFNS